MCMYEYVVSMNSRYVRMYVHHKLHMRRRQSREDVAAT